MNFFSILQSNFHIKIFLSILDSNIPHQDYVVAYCLSRPVNTIDIDAADIPAICNNIPDEIKLCVETFMFIYF